MSGVQVSDGTPPSSGSSPGGGGNSPGGGDTAAAGEMNILAAAVGVSGLLALLAVFLAAYSYLARRQRRDEEFRVSRARGTWAGVTAHQGATTSSNQKCSLPEPEVFRGTPEEEVEAVMRISTITDGRVHPLPEYTEQAET